MLVVSKCLPTCLLKSELPMEPSIFHCVLKDSLFGRLLTCSEKEVNQTLTATHHQIPSWYFPQ